MRACSGAGAPGGVDFLAADVLERHPEYSWQKPYCGISRRDRGRGFRRGRTRCPKPAERIATGICFVNIGVNPDAEWSNQPKYNPKQTRSQNHRKTADQFSDFPFGGPQYSLSTGVSTIIRAELLSAVCEISIETSQSSAFTLAFCKNAFAI